MKEKGRATLLQAYRGVVQNGAAVPAILGRPSLLAALLFRPPATTLGGLPDSGKLCIDTDAFQDRMMQNILRLCASC